LVLHLVQRPVHAPELLGARSGEAGWRFHEGRVALAWAQEN
jgi:hypothetical protein